MDHTVSPRSKVLVIEDEPLVCDLLCSIVECSGHSPVRGGITVVSALETIENYNVDAAILDINICATTSYPVASVLTQKAVP